MLYAPFIEKMHGHYLCCLQPGGRHLKPPKFEHIFVAVITFPPFFCANTIDTSLLLIVCALRWYVKSLYRHFFLEDISKHASVTQKIAPPSLPWLNFGIQLFCGLVPNSYNIV